MQGVTPMLRTVHRLLDGLTALASAGVILSCGWLGTMEFVLRHPNYPARMFLALVIVLEAVLTLAVVLNLAPAWLGRTLAAAAIPTGVLGVYVVREDLSRPGFPGTPHFEGYL